MGDACSKNSRNNSVDHIQIKKSLRVIQKSAKETQRHLADEVKVPNDDIISWDDGQMSGGILDAKDPELLCRCHQKTIAFGSLVNSQKFSDCRFRLPKKRKTMFEEEKGLSLDSDDEFGYGAGDDLGDTTASSTSSGGAGGGVHQKSVLDDEDCETVYAIRSVLSAMSPVFKAMLTSGKYLEAADDEDSVIDIPDCSAIGFTTMLQYIYTNSIDYLDSENIIDTMYCAHKYQIEGLMLECSRFVKEKLSVSNVCKFLNDSDVWVSAAFMKFISVHAEEVLQSDDFLKLSKAKVINIIQSDLLAVNDELQVFNAVLEWGHNKLREHDIDLTPKSLRAEIDDIIEYVRFPLMDSNHLLGEVHDTGILTPEEVYEIIMFWSKRGEFKTKFLARPRKMRFIDLRYESDFDKNGIIYWIGSQGDTREFQNPGANGETTNHMSSTEMGTASNLTGRTTVQNYTNNITNSTMSLDLGGDRLLSPNYYTIRHGFASANYYPRNWVFEGSTDGTRWEGLKTHTNDQKITQPHATGSWELDLTDVDTEQGGEPKYSKFRIRNTGLDSSNSNYLMICGIEVYGKLYTRERHGEAFKKRNNSRNGGKNKEYLYERGGFAQKKKI